MKNYWITGVAAVFMGASVILTSCGNNTEMPPESTEGNTRETGANRTGDLPGTGSSDSLSTNSMGTGTDSIGMGTTTGGTTAGTTAGNTAGGTTAGTSSGTTAGSTSGNTSGTTVGTTSGSTSTGTSSGMTTGGSTTSR